MQQGGNVKYIDVSNMSKKEAIAVINNYRAEVGLKPVTPPGWLFTICLALGFMS